MPDFRSCRALRLPLQALRINFDLRSKSRHPSRWRQVREASRLRSMRTGFEVQSNPKNRAALSQRSEEHTSELQSLMRTPYAVFCLKKKKTNIPKQYIIKIINKPSITIRISQT